MRKSEIRSMRLAIAKCYPWPWSLRKEFTSKDLKNARAQLLKRQVCPPLIVYLDEGSYTVIGGNLNLKVLKSLDITHIFCIVLKGSGEELRPKLEQLKDSLDITVGQAVKALDEAKTQGFARGVPGRKIKLVGVEGFALSASKRKELKRIDQVVVKFSGGRDSSLAVAWARQEFPKAELFGFFADPGVEFPGMAAHARHVMHFFGGKLAIVKSEKEWWTWIEDKGWPSILYRPCQAIFVHNPVVRLVSHFNPARTLLLDGSRLKQAVRGSEKNKESPWPDPKVDKFTAYHPVFDLSPEAFQQLLKDLKVPLWEGYEMGFVRTACWCCPFQCGAQARALAKNFPGLTREFLKWEEKLGPIQPLCKKPRYFRDMIANK